MLSISGSSPRPVPMYGMGKKATTLPHTHTNLFRVGSEAWVELSVFKTPRSASCLPTNRMNKKTQEIYKRCERAEEGGGQIKNK